MTSPLEELEKFRNAFPVLDTRQQLSEGTRVALEATGCMRRVLLTGPATVQTTRSNGAKDLNLDFTDGGNIVVQKEQAALIVGRGEGTLEVIEMQMENRPGA